MRYIKLGRTGLDVSPVALGAMSYGEPGRGHPVWSLPEEDSRPLIRQAVEAGVNFFDTPNMYSHGSSEESLGRALRGFAHPDAILLPPKAPPPTPPAPPPPRPPPKATLAPVP